MSENTTVTECINEIRNTLEELGDTVTVLVGALAPIRNVNAPVDPILENPDFDISPDTHPPVVLALRSHLYLLRAEVTRLKNIKGSLAL